VLIFVNSFSFLFLEFLAKMYWANFFSRAKNAKKERFTGDGTGLAPGTGWAGQPGPTGLVGDRRRFASVFSPIRSFSSSLFGQKILREV
jgi:hypothetical protein